MSTAEGSAGDDDVWAYARTRVGQTLRGKYHLDRLLGVGGMASVYGATHRNGRRVALKLLHPELSIRADLRMRFLREAQAANAVEHPGAVIVIDDDVAEDGATFLVMELLDGKSVEELWEEHDQRLPTTVVLTIARDLCDVLVAAHRAGVVHRDLKPANLFVTRDGQLKVLDFGIARVRDDAGPRATRTGMILGTPAFMAPEQAGGMTSQVDHVTDLWAVGATMFTLLSGRCVHEAESSQRIVVLAATTPARSLATVAPKLAPEIVSLVDRALAFERADRWQSAAEFRDAISAATATTTTDADPLTGLSDTIMAAPDHALGIARTLESARNNGPTRSLLGGTTGQPVSSASATTVRRGRVRYRSRPVVIAGACILLISSVVVFGLNRRKSNEGVAPTHDTSATQPQLPSIAESVTDQDSTDRVPPPIAVLEAVSGAPTASASNSRAARSTRLRQRSVSASTATTPASAKLNCDPPFDVQDGIRIHRAGCP